MVSITVSVSPEIRALMLQFPEVNWSGLVKKTITEKAKELAWREEMLKHLKGEQEFDEWAVQAAKESRKGRFGKLQKKGLV